MAQKARGRPPLTEDVLRGRIQAYCGRYGVSVSPESGLPAFPTGRRETKQHREWMVLYKAWRRLQARQGRDGARQEALVRQGGRCPICLEAVGSTDPWAPAAPERPPAVVHAECALLIRAASRLGPRALERLRAHLWPEGLPPGASGAAGKGSRARRGPA